MLETATTTRENPFEISCLEETEFKAGEFISKAALLGVTAESQHKENPLQTALSLIFINSTFVVCF